MRTLEACYEINFSKVNFQERKIKITEPKTIISGAFKTGKSYLIYDFLSSFKSKRFSTLYEAIEKVLALRVNVSKNKNRIFSKIYLRQFFCNIIEDIIL